MKSVLNITIQKASSFTPVIDTDYESEFYF